MPFPISYYGEIDWVESIKADAPKYKNIFMEEMSIKLKEIGLQEVHVWVDSISFGGGRPQIFSNKNWLTALSGGEIKIISRGQKLIISYYLSFKGNFILLSLVFLSLLLVLINNSPVSNWSLALIIISIWLVVISMTFSAIVPIFPRLIKDVLSEIEGSVVSQHRI